jgi:hypothetical protein
VAPPFSALTAQWGQRSPGYIKEQDLTMKKIQHEEEEEKNINRVLSMPSGSGGPSFEVRIQSDNRIRINCVPVYLDPKHAEFGSVVDPDP